MNNSSKSVNAAAADLSAKNQLTQRLLREDQWHQQRQLFQWQLRRWAANDVTDLIHSAEHAIIKMRSVD